MWLNGGNPPASQRGTHEDSPGHEASPSCLGSPCKACGLLVAPCQWARWRGLSATNLTKLLGGPGRRLGEGRRGSPCWGLGRGSREYWMAWGNTWGGIYRSSGRRSHLESPASQAPNHYPYLSEGYNEQRYWLTGLAEEISPQCWFTLIGLQWEYGPRGPGT